MYIFIYYVMSGIDKLFEEFAPVFKQKGAELVKKVGHVYQFEILKQKGYDVL